MIVLGLHGGVTVGQHEPAAALAVNGRIIAACEEERYLRNKSAYGYLPYYSIRACLKIANIDFRAIDLVVTPGASYPRFDEVWRDYLRHNFGSSPRIERVHHHMAHLASAFYGSGHREALCLSLDATGDGDCAMLAHATRGDGITVLEEIPTERSLGYFYTLMTYYLGFVDGDEYKVMGLAPYGRPSVDLSPIIRPAPHGWEFDWSFVRADPPVKSPFEPLYAAKLAEVLGVPNRRPEEPITDFHRDVASSTQAVTEDCVLRLAEHLRGYAPSTRHLCYAGGLALNCSANRRLLYADMFDHIYVSPVSSDRGLALGCAYLGAVMLGDSPWPLLHAYLGSCYSDADIRHELEANGCRFEELEDPAATGACLLADGKILGWFQGRSEAGARALGNRSIVASCASQAMRDRVNARIKFREEFRPFAPSLLQEAAGDWFAVNGRPDFPYMTFTLDAIPERAPTIAAVVHVDGTARVQTVRSSDNEIYYEMIRRYANETGVPVILNTSFNLKGQPIIESPRDALMTFYGCGLDALVIGNFLVHK
ncbi:MAG TPA: carbamoyltransferase C-terminal domain-containing protein [bacterium]|nr:carbamoyltransferase C-terminal domain-containing protein [bacterium]